MRVLQSELIAEVRYILNQVIRKRSKYGAFFSEDFVKIYVMPMGDPHYNAYKQNRLNLHIGEYYGQPKYSTFFNDVLKVLDDNDITIIWEEYGN